MSEGAPALSCCVVAWNAAGRLPRLLRSLEAERAAGVALEVIVVDNASGDGTAELVRRDFPAARLIASPTNLGYAAGQSLARREATGAALLFLNDDVVVPPGALAALLRELEAHPEAVAIGPALVGDDGVVQRSAGPLPTLGAALHRVRWLRWTRLSRRAHDAFRRAPIPPAGPVECLMGAAILVRREAYEKEPWDPGFPFGLEDADLSARLGRLGPLRFAPEVKLQHAGGVASAANPSRVVRGFEVGWVRYVAKRQGTTRAMLLAMATVADLPLRAMLLALRGLGLVVRGRGGDARATIAQARATAWSALAGGSELLRAAEHGRGLTPARFAAAIVPLLIAGSMAAAYWPVLRTISPQLAVDAAGQAAFAREGETPFEWWIQNPAAWAQPMMGEPAPNRDPWGREWCEPVTFLGGVADIENVMRVDTSRASRHWMAPVAQAHWLFLLAGSAAFACVVAASPRLLRSAEPLLFAISVAPAIPVSQVLVDYVIEHPWLIPAEWRSELRLRITAVVVVAVAGLVMRFHLRPRSEDTPIEPLSAIPARNP